MEKVIRKIDTRKFRLAMIKLAIAACTVVTMCGTAMVALADNAENTKPADVKTTTMTSLIGIVFWVIRVAILIIGGGPSIIKIVQGQTDENPRDRNAGIAGLVITGAAFAASFAIEKLI